MNYEDVQKLSNAAKNKIGLLNGNFLDYKLPTSLDTPSPASVR